MRVILVIAVVLAALPECATRAPLANGRAGSGVAAAADTIGIHFWIAAGLPTDSTREDSMWSDQGDGDSVSVVLTPAMGSTAVLSVDILVRRFDTDSEIAEGAGPTRIIHWVVNDTLDLATLPVQRGGRRIGLLQPEKMDTLLHLAANEFVETATFQVRLPDGRVVVRTVTVMVSI